MYLLIMIFYTNRSFFLYGFLFNAGNSNEGGFRMLGILGSAPRHARIRADKGKEGEEEEKADNDFSHGFASEGMSIILNPERRLIKRKSLQDAFTWIKS